MRRSQGSGLRDDGDFGTSVDISDIVLESSGCSAGNSDAFPMKFDEEGSILDNCTSLRSSSTRNDVVVEPADLSVHF